MITNDIRKGIKERKSWNKLRRKAKTIELKDYYHSKNKEQKVQNMIREAMRANERKIADQIKRSPNRTKRLWEHIRKLKGEDRTKSKTETYDEAGRKLSKIEVEKEAREVWENIYIRNPSKIII